MAKDPTGSPRRIVLYSPSAVRDLAAIYAYTADLWSERQVEEYLDFLDGKLREIAADPTCAPLVQNLNKVRSRIVRWKNTRQGHRIFYEESNEGITVLRILHTAMDWNDLLGEE